MADHRFQSLYEPVLEQIAEQSSVADGAFIDKEIYQVNITTLWANVVMDPESGGIAPDDLEALHDYLNERIPEVLGRTVTLTHCFRFLQSRRGLDMMDRLQLPQVHKDMLSYFASMILDPDGHRRWMDEIREKQQRRT